MKNKKSFTILFILLLLTLFTRFYNLMHDSPYFFNPDERNMASAITRFRLPTKLSDISSCLFSEFIPPNLQPTTYNPQPSSCTLNPHFFAYGQFPLYLAYASDQIHKSVFSLLPRFIPTYQDDPYMREESRATSFDHAIFWLRFWSAIASSLTVLFVYLIAKLLFVHCKLSRHRRDPAEAGKIENYAALAAACTPSLIQSAHFGTTESILTFCFMGILYYSLKLLNTLSFRSSFLISLLLGIALGSKLTGAFFFIPPALTIFFLSLRSLRERNLIHLLGYWLTGLCILIGSIFFFILSSPYNFVAWKDFLGTVFGYEQSVATGAYLAFYTRQFVDTIPIIFQIEKVFPYALGWPIFILGSIGFILILIQLFISFLKTVFMGISKLFRIKKLRSKRHRFNLQPITYNLQLFILSSSFLIYLLPNAFLFAKWTRFMTPILPFFALFAAFYIDRILQLLLSAPSKVQRSKFKDQKQVKSSKRFYTLRLVLISALCALSFLPGFAFFSIYTKPDSRVTASYWIWNTIPDHSFVLSETANVVDIPVGIPDELVPRKNLEVISFDFYHMDGSPEIFENLLGYLGKSQYIFIPSRRIFANHMRLAETYPLTNKYYQLLASGRLGFEKVEEFSSFPTLGLGPFKMEFPDEAAEESFTVFDHPVVRIYKKTIPYSKDEYRRMFQI